LIIVYSYVSEANCGVPPDFEYTTKEYVSSDMYTKVGAIVRYTTTRSGYIIATKLDAIGQRFTESADPTTAIITCQHNGRWSPPPSNIRVQGKNI